MSVRFTVPPSTESNPITRANDAFRKAPFPFDWVATAGVHALGEAFMACAIKAVCRFDAFTSDNDPYGEHDFGSITLDGHKLFWKIDCYDRSDMTRGSEDPANPLVTRRIMTIMLASEY